MERIVFDNSALNHLFEQSPNIDEAARQGVIEKMRATGAPEVALNAALLGEVAGLFFSKPPRFGRIARFLFATCTWRLVRPAFDDEMRPTRIAIEVQHRGPAPWEKVVISRRETKWMVAAFVDGKRTALDELARDAKERKEKFAVGERRRRADAQALLDQNGQLWEAEFKGWATDPQAVVDEWTLHEMRRSPSFYGLPEDESSWPAPRQFVSLWFARAYHVARLHDIFARDIKSPDPGDLYDGMYFQEAAYAETLVTGDKTLASRARSLRLTTPRVMSTEEWVADLLG